MPEVAEQVTQKLEAILTEPSAEPEEVSEETKPEEEVKAEVKPEEPVDPKIEARIQAEADKRANKYRETRESDTALIRRLQQENTEFKKQSRVKNDDKLVSVLLAGYEEEGNPPEKKEDFATNLKNINQKIAEYNEKSAEVKEAAQFISDMTEKLPANIVKEFGLNDSNPNVRAINGAKFLDETVAVFKYNQNFLKAVEKFLPKGDEVRKQLEEVIKGMADFEGNDKAKDLYLTDRLKGLKAIPRKRPATPSDVSGGVDLDKMSPRELIAYGLKNKK